MKKLRKIKYGDLSEKQQEGYNFQKIAAVLADYGFYCIRLADDWRKEDFLATHIDNKTVLNIQLKGRLTINKKYQDSKIIMAFPVSEKEFSDKRKWFLIEHDELVNLVGKNTNALNTKSWREGGEYSFPSPSKKLMDTIAPYALCVNCICPA